MRVPPICELLEDSTLRTVGVVSLGCSKNRVDTELMLGILRGHGYRITADEREAEILIVNTCGFIDPAKQESIDTLLSMAKYKKKGKCKLLVATGSLFSVTRKPSGRTCPRLTC